MFDNKYGVAKCWIFSIFTLTHTKVKVKKSENAVPLREHRAASKR